MKSRIAFIVIGTVLLLPGCAINGTGPCRVNNPPWLMAWDGPIEVRSELVESISVGMTSSDVKEELRRKGVRDWSRVPEVYHEYLRVSENPEESVFQLADEQEWVPHGDHNYAVFQEGRIGIAVPCYRCKPRRGYVVCYPAPEFGVAVVSFRDDVVTEVVYEPLAGHDYSIQRFSAQMKVVEARLEQN